MLRGFLLFTVFLLIGESASFLLALPINGSVVGMLLLTLWLMFTGNINEDLVTASQQLISVLVFLIMPGVVGVFFLSEDFAKQWITVGIALVIGTLLSVFTTLVLMRSCAPDDKDVDNHG